MRRQRRACEIAGNRELLAEQTQAPRGYLYQVLAGVGWTSWLWLSRVGVSALIMMGEPTTRSCRR